MKCKRFKNKFTLVELLVSMGVFSILLVLFMQFFSGTQKIWSSGEKNNVLDARARAILNTLSTFIQCAYYTTGNPESNHKDSFFFRIDKGSSSTDADKQPDSLYCAVKAKMDLPGKDLIRFISVQLPQKNDSMYNSCSDYYGKLLVTVLCDDFDVDEKAAEYARFFPEYRANSTTYPTYTYGGASSAYEQAFSDLIGILNQKINANYDKAENCRFVLAKNVVDFNMEIGTVDSNEHFSPLSASVNENIKPKLPNGNSGSARYAIDLEPTVLKGTNMFGSKFTVKITISLLSDLDYERWSAISNANDAKKFRLENQKTYSRLIYLGDRWAQ